MKWKTTWKMKCKLGLGVSLDVGPAGTTRYVGIMKGLWRIRKDFPEKLVYGVGGVCGKGLGTGLTVPPLQGIYNKDCIIWGYSADDCLNSCSSKGEPIQGPRSKSDPKHTAYNL